MNEYVLFSMAFIVQTLEVFINIVFHFKRNDVISIVI